MSKIRLIVDFLANNESVPTNDPKDQTAIKKTVEESSFTELCRKQVAVPDAASDQAITLADATSEYLIIFVDQTVTIKLNGSGDALTLSPSSAGVKTPVFVQKGIITSLTVSNASGSTANLDVISVNV